eukprot:c996_g1_i2 orf=43-366(-)
MELPTPTMSIIENDASHEYTFACDPIDHCVASIELVIEPTPIIESIATFETPLFESIETIPPLYIEDIPVSIKVSSSFSEHEHNDTHLSPHIKTLSPIVEPFKPLEG